MSVPDCLNLARSSPQYGWLLNDTTLWRHLAVRDLKCSVESFDQQLNSMNPVEVYQHLARCQHHDTPHPTSRCQKHIIPGASYCLRHCEYRGIKMCTCCYNQVMSPSDRTRFCSKCEQTEAWKNGCRYIFQRGPFNGKPCGSKRLPGSDYCIFCVPRSHFNG
jgi:hypothetical protein